MLEQCLSSTPRSFIFWSLTYIMNVRWILCITRIISSFWLIAHLIKSDTHKSLVRIWSYKNAVILILNYDNASLYSVALKNGSPSPIGAAVSSGGSAGLFSRFFVPCRMSSSYVTKDRCYIIVSNKKFIIDVVVWLSQFLVAVRLNEIRKTGVRIDCERKKFEKIRFHRYVT